MKEPVKAESQRITVSAKSRRYDAFISYSTELDTVLARALEIHLERFAKPWFRLRSINIFRDETSLATNPGLWPAIVWHLNGSAFLVVLASESAAKSKWVRKEICHWITDGACSDPQQLDRSQIKQDKVKRVLLVLTEGAIVWDDTACDFDWLLTTALPQEVLSGAFHNEPSWNDLRWTRGPAKEAFDRTNEKFMQAVAKLSVPIRGLDIKSLIRTDYREHKKTKRIAWIAYVASAILAILTVVLPIAMATPHWSKVASFDLPEVPSYADLPTYMCVAVSGTGDIAIGSATNGNVRVIFSDGSQNLLPGLSGYVSHLGFAESERCLLGIARDSKGAILWDIDTGKRLFDIACPSGSWWCMSRCLKSGRWYMATDEGTVWQIGIDGTLSKVFSLPHDEDWGRIQSIDICKSMNGLIVCFSDRGPATINLHDGTVRLLFRDNRDDVHYWMCTVVGSRWLAVALDESTRPGSSVLDKRSIYVGSLKGENLRWFESSSHFYTTIVAFPASNLFLTHDQGGEVNLWNARTGEKVHGLTPREAMHLRMFAIAFDGNSQTLCVAAKDSIEKWQLSWDTLWGIPVPFAPRLK